MTVADPSASTRAMRFAQAVMTLCGALFCAVVISTSPTQLSWAHTVLLCAFAGVGVWLAIVDIAQHRLPNRVLLPAIAVFAVAVIAISLATGDGWAAVRALGGGAVCFAIFFAIALLSGGAIGGGDVKLLAFTSMLSAWISLTALALAIVSAFVLAGLVAVMLIVARRSSASSTIAFGPFLCLGAWVGIGGVLSFPV